MDNLSLIKNDIDVFIDPNGAPGSILAVNNQNIFKAILEKVGKYTGSPFIAKRNLTLFSPGDFSWNGNAMNNEDEFTISISKQTTDLNDIGLILDTLIPNDLIQFKDFNGRSIFLTYYSHTQMTDGNGAIYFDIVVSGFSTNLNYTYQVNESQIAVISFHKKINEFSDAPIDGETYARKDGGWESFDLSQKADLVGGLVPSSQLPSYVDDVLEFANLASFPATGETSKIYLALDTNKTYRWGGSSYIQLSSGIDFPSDGKTYGVKDGLPVDLGVNILNEFPNSIIIQATGAGVSYLGTYAMTFTGTQSDLLIGGGGVSYRKVLSTSTAGSNANIYDAGIYRVLPGIGFYYRARIKNEDATNITSGRFSYGFSGTAIMGNINPSSYTQALLSLGADNTDSNCQIFYKNSSGGTNKIDLGATMPKTQLDEYIIEFLRHKGSTTIYYKITNLTTGVVISNNFTFALNSIALGIFRNNESVASACGFALRRVELYIGD